MQKMYDELDREITIGSLVRLASDGPPMTVVGLHIAGEPLFKEAPLVRNSESTIRVAFFELASRLRIEKFPAAALRAMHYAVDNVPGEYSLLTIRVAEEIKRHPLSEEQLIAERERWAEATAKDLAEAEALKKSVDEQREQFLADRSDRIAAAAMANDKAVAVVEAPANPAAWDNAMAAMAAIEAVHDEEVADKIESEEDRTAGWDGPNR